MSDLPTIEDLLARNREYAANKFQARPRLRPSLPVPPEPKWSQILIIACADSRCNPHDVLGIQSSEATILRNASGRFAAAASDIPGLDCLLDLKQIIILQHSDCVATFATKDQVVDDIRKKRPEVREDQLQQLKTRMPLRVDSTDALIQDMRDLRDSPFLRKDLTSTVVGLYLDVDTGLVKQVTG